MKAPAMQFTSDITVELIQQCGSDAMIAAAAKVSVSPEESLRLAEAEQAEGVRGLIRYLMRSRHGSPFEHGLMTFYVHAPIFVLREWHRHRTWSFNEESARYKELDPVFWVPSEDRKMIPVEGFKSARPEFERISTYEYDSARDIIEEGYYQAYGIYKTLLGRGIAREVARAMLPVGTYSGMYATCNPRSLMHFVSLRTHDKNANHVSYPQREIEQAADECEKFFAKHWPISYNAFNEFGREAP